MESQFKCLYCGAEKYHRLTPRFVIVRGSFYFQDTDNYLYLDHTFCNIECLLNYIAEWNTDEEQI